MKTLEFLTLLEEHKSSELTFEHDKGEFVAPTYHITEIKNVSIESVDCGGNPDAYKQTIVQLWVPPKEELRKPWTAKKALSIFEIADKITPLDREAPIFFEFGNEKIRTSNFSVENVDASNGTMNVQMFVAPTVCKPRLKNEMVCC